MKHAAAETTHTAADTFAAAKDYVEQGVEKLTPLYNEGVEKLAPLAEQAKAKGASAAGQALDALQPKMNEVLEKVAPAVATAQGALNSWVPKAQAALDEAAKPVLEAAKPAVAAAAPVGRKVAKKAAKQANLRAKQLEKTAKAADKALAKAERKSKDKGKGWLVPLLVLAGLGGIAVLLYKKFMAPADNEWQSHSASAYTSNPDSDQAAPKETGTSQSFTEQVDVPAADAATEAAAPAAEAAPKAPEAAAPAAEAAPKAPEAAAPATEAAAKAAEAPAAVTESSTYGVAGEYGVTDSAPTTGDTLADSPAAESTVGSKYGAGAYVGDQPPAGYDIKGNERSKKFHTPGTGGYERTIAEVWFNSEEAAEAAGFTKAQR